MTPSSITDQIYDLSTATLAILATLDWPRTLPACNVPEYSVIDTVTLSAPPPADIYISSNKLYIDITTPVGTYNKSFEQIKFKKIKIKSVSRSMLYT